MEGKPEEEHREPTSEQPPRTLATKGQESRIVHHGGPEILEMPLQRAHVQATPRKKALTRRHVVQQLLPHSCRWRWKHQKRGRHLLKLGQPCFGRKHHLERSVYQHAQILNSSGRVEVRLLPVDDNAQVPAQLEN